MGSTESRQDCHVLLTLAHLIVKDDCEEVWGKIVALQYSRCDFKPAYFCIWRHNMCLRVLIHLSNCVHKFVRYAICLEDSQHFFTTNAVESLWKIEKKNYCG